MKTTIQDNNCMNPENFISEDSISLTLEQVNQAATVSQTLATHPRQQWQAYLNILARLGIIEWLQQRAPELSVLTDKLQDSMSSVSQLQVSDFKLILIVTDSSMNTEVCVPRESIENSINSSQVYVLVEVIEDLPVLEDAEEQVNISVLGYLTSEQLNQHNPTILDDELGLLSMDWFELKPDSLLLYLRCFEPQAIPSQASSEVLQQKPSQPILNVGNWLKNQFDQIAEDLSWTLLPPLAYGSAFRDLRSPIELFRDAAIELREQAQLFIPIEARTAYRELVWEEVSMWLFATTWQINTNINSPEWTLLLLLTAQPSSSLPIGTQLVVRDELQVLEEPIRTHPTQDYIYAQVIGAYDEQFYVTISLPNEIAITLPPFTFSC
ncbi:MAG: DUF1822 family protein [Cyanobacteria bacterium J06592_8]